MNLSEVLRLILIILALLATFVGVTWASIASNMWVDGDLGGWLYFFSVIFGILATFAHMCIIAIFSGGAV